MANIGIGVDSPHAVAPGQTLKFDMQVDIAGYHSDIGRTYAIEPTADQRAIYATLRDALAVLEDAVRPGVTFAELYAIGTGAMHRAGFTNYSRGHLGHSLGLTQRLRGAALHRARRAPACCPEYGAGDRDAVLRVRRRRVPAGADGRRDRDRVRAGRSAPLRARAGAA